MGPFPVSSRAGERNAPQDSPPPWPCLATAALPPLAAARVVPRSSSRPAVRFPGRRPAPRTIAPRAKRHPGPDPALPPATPRRPAPRRPSAAEPPTPPPASGLPGPSEWTCVGEGSRWGPSPTSPRLEKASGRWPRARAREESWRPPARGELAVCLFLLPALSRNLGHRKAMQFKENAIQTWPDAVPPRRRFGPDEPRTSSPPGAAASLAEGEDAPRGRGGWMRRANWDQGGRKKVKIPDHAEPLLARPASRRPASGRRRRFPSWATRGAATRGGDRGRKPRGRA